MMNLLSLRYLGQLAILAAGYFAVAKMGLTFAIPPGNATAVWPASGIALAAVLLMGFGVWPGIWLGAALASLTTGISAVMAAAIGTGNTLEAVLGAWLLRRFLSPVVSFRRTDGAFFLAAGAAASCTVAATVGATSLLAGGYIQRPEFLVNWSTWWLGDMAGVTIVVPLILACSQRRRSSLARWQWVEIGLLLPLLVLASHCIFGGWLPEHIAKDLLYLPLLLLLWVALRFELFEVALATALFSMAAIWGTSRGLGAYSTEAFHQSLFNLQLFMNVYAVTGLAVVGTVASRRDAEEALRKSHGELEQVVLERTRDLVRTNEALSQEVAERTRAERTLRESEQRFRTLFEQAGDSLFLIEPNGNFVDANQLACATLGYSREELLALSVWNVDSPIDRAAFGELYRGLQQGEPTIRESSHRRKDGSTFPVEIRAGLVELQGTPHILSLARDITQRQRIQEVERLRLATALESIGEGIIITDADGTIQYVNPAFERITGYTRPEVIGKSPRILQSGMHDESFYRRLWETIANGDVWRGSFVDRRKDRTLYDVDATIAPIRENSEVTVGYVAVSRDVTESRRSERALRDSETRIRAIVEGAAEGIITIDDQGKIESCNPATEKIFGYSPAELIGENVDMLMPSPYREEHEGHLERYRRTGQRKLIGSVRELRGKRKDGTTFPMDLGVSEVQLADRRLFTGIVRDVTERHARFEAEKALLATNEELRVATAIQQRLFPASPPSVAGFSIAGVSYPAEATGGDYFDYLPMPHGRIGIVVADVSGHGLSSALVMSETRAYLRALMQMCDGVDALVTRLNEFLIEDFSDDKFVTLFLAQLDPRDRSLVYASAGHQCYLLESTGDVTPLTATGIPLGIGGDNVTSSPSRLLQSGDLLLFTTDGVDETCSPEGRAFGIERTQAVAWENRDKPAREIVDTLYSTIRDFAQSQPQQDDVTVVVVKVEEP